MNINLTLFGEMITFTLFVWFTMRFVWPPMMQAIEERQKTIADGLEAATRGQRDLVLSQDKAKEVLREAKADAAALLDQANKRVAQEIEAAKQQAREEGQRLVEMARSEITQEKSQAQEELRGYVADLAMRGAQKILQRNLDAEANAQLIEQLINEI